MPRTLLVVEQAWDGITRSETLSDWAAKARHRLADAAKAYDWPGVFDVLDRHPEMVNTTRPDGASWYAPLHQAAHGGAPADVVRRLIELGAWRSLRNARGERPVDVARRMGHPHLEILEPPWRASVPEDVLEPIQIFFHALIRARANKLVDQHQLRLPELEVLLEFERLQLYFAVPGMYGGFSCHLKGEGRDTRLVSESWSRIVGGSEQRHEIDPNQVRLVERPGGHQVSILYDPLRDGPKPQAGPPQG